MFVFKYTATTELYTYLHTLSLHAALPIAWLRPDLRAALHGTGRRLAGAGRVYGRSHGAGRRCVRSGPARDTFLHYGVGRVYRAFRRGGSRSEEHTSELQSLMRISYAVFCLKKNKINYTKGNREHNNTT